MQSLLLAYVLIVNYILIVLTYYIYCNLIIIIETEKQKMRTSWRYTMKKISIMTGVCVAAVVAASLFGYSRRTGEKTIVDEWNSVDVPPPPKLEAVTLDPKSSAILVLDIQQQNCNASRPRCAASVPRIRRLLDEGRGKVVVVVYSVFPGAVASDILADVAPRAGEPVVTSGPDKFLGTELEKLLRDKGVKTVVIVGCSAHGAVLHTAGSAAFRGFEVVVPVDGMSAVTAYAEQYTAWHLANAPILGNHMKLTRCDLVNFSNP
jgi:nicotinamidase-related amidase